MAGEKLYRIAAFVTTMALTLQPRRPQIAGDRLASAGKGVFAFRSLIVAQD